MPYRSLVRSKVGPHRPKGYRDTRERPEARATLRTLIDTLTMYPDERRRVVRLLLRDLMEDVTGHRVPIKRSLNSAVWDAVMPDVVGFLHDPDLVGSFALHFQRVTELGRLQDQLLDASVGVGATITTAAELKPKLNGLIATECQALLATSSDLVNRVGQHVNRLQPP
jgi:hypothetical protein